MLFKIKFSFEKIVVSYATHTEFRIGLLEPLRAVNAFTRVKGVTCLLDLAVVVSSAQDIR